MGRKEGGGQVGGLEVSVLKGLVVNVILFLSMMGGILCEGYSRGHMESFGCHVEETL